MGATVGSEQTAAAEGTVGQVRRDPMAMLPSSATTSAITLQHWLSLGEKADADKLPRISTSTGSAVVPTAASCGRASARTAACSRVDHRPDRGQGRRSGDRHRHRRDAGVAEPRRLDVEVADVAEALAVDNAQWQGELPSINEWFDFIGDKLPQQLRTELDTLTARLAQD